MKKEALRYLLLFSTILLSFQPLAYSKQTIEDKHFEELKLINPSETLEDAKVRVSIRSSLIIIFHSKGVMNAEPKRFPKEILDGLNYYSAERTEYEKKRVEDEKKRKLEAEAHQLLVGNIEKKINESYNKQFSDDRHPHAERIIAASLKDPDSYRFIQSEASLVYSQHSNRYERYRVPVVKVSVKYSATNSYGGRIADIEELFFCINGDYIGSKLYNLRMKNIEQTETTLGVSKDDIDKYVKQIEQNKRK